MALKEILVEWETFNFKVWCVIGPHKHLRAYIKKRHRRVYRAPKDAKSYGGMYFASKPKIGGILWLEAAPNTPEHIGFLAHEISHAVMDMHSQREIVVDHDNDEPFCYAVGHGVRAVLEACK